MEIRPVLVALLHVDRRTDKYDEVIFALVTSLPTSKKRVNIVEKLDSDSPGYNAMADFSKECSVYVNISRKCRDKWAR
jgi:hypothetical protein